MNFMDRDEIKDAICKVIDDNWDGSKSLDISISLRVDEVPVMRIRNKKIILPCHSSMVKS